MPDSITDIDGLRDIYAEPKGAPLDKTQYKLDEHSRRFIAASPFVVLGTNGDVSPRGDDPGFVHVIDDNTVLLPDRKGNNRLDSMQNIVEDPTVALMFLIPGISETFRIRGEAEITTDPALLEPLAVNGQVPASGLIIHVKEAYIHCAKAILRSKIWGEDNKLDRKEFAATKIIAAHTNRSQADYDAYYEDNMKQAMAEEGREYDK
ncbi:MAG: pyridoxamine 5'-phosphate oxidase family protein [Rhodospirillaceae bacterium]|jgi:hypothetical protein|nr:pyridoxamine 5'-phosphate oxidase family protein [Rhodospirillaceae bacterium]MBT7266813.1 pyridoxamine 5'-phosphate oxidase family protein [Rhodospirillaceae bacterium]